MTITKISGSSKPKPQINHNKDEGKDKDKDKGINGDVPHTLVEDETLFPRCEFFHRFGNTSRFENDIRRAHVYTRSEDARYVQGNKSDVKFVPTSLTNGLNTATNSLSAHTGGFASPYVLPEYSNNIQLKKHKFGPQSPTPVKSEIYDELLNYKLGLCNHIAAEFSKQIPHADLGGSRYRAKIVKTIPTINDFKNTDIIIRKWRSGKYTHVQLYTVIKDKLSSVSLSDNQELVDKLAAIRVGSDRQLEELLKEFQPYLLSKNLHPHRDMQGVYCSNKYPCVLVRFTPKIAGKAASDAELKTIYKRYNHMLMAYFMAIVNYNAHQDGIDIEMLGRSGFGQNNPGIAVTDKSFRINIGLVPKAYADIIVKSLVQLHHLFHLLENTQPDQHLKMEPVLRTTLNKAREIGFKESTLPETYWEALWIKGSNGPTGRILLSELIERERDRPELLANFVLHVIIRDPKKFFKKPALAEAPLAEMFKLVEYTTDATLRYQIHSLKSDELKKKKDLKEGIHRTKDNKYFQVINQRTPRLRELELKDPSRNMSVYKTNQQLSHTLCTALFKGYVSPQPYKISVHSKPALEKQSFFQFTKPSHKKVSDDPKLATVLKKVCNGLGIDFPPDLKVRDMYRFLETAHIEFICKKRTRTLSQLGKLSEWGSDSETEASSFVKAKSIFAKKVIVANGMLAINLSYYAARSAIYLLDAINEMADDDDVDEVFINHHWEMDACSRKMSVNCHNTYFETISGDPKNPLCLDSATNPPVHRKDAKADILMFDLNSFKADFIAQKANLREQLEITQPMVVVLDHTSSTTSEIRNAIKTVYEVQPSVCMVLLVTSGLKNEQGGADNNPYGKLTILSLADKGEKNTLTNFIYDEITALRSPDTDVKLSKKALLPKAAHAIRHSYKDRGFTTTAHSILHDDIDEMLDELTSESETLGESSHEDELAHIDHVDMCLH